MQATKLKTDPNGVVRICPADVSRLVNESDDIKNAIRGGRRLENLDASLRLTPLGAKQEQYRIDLRVVLGSWEFEHKLPKSFEQGVLAELEWNTPAIWRKDPRALDDYAKKYPNTTRGREAKRLLDEELQDVLKRRPSDDADLVGWRVEYLGKFMTVLTQDQITVELTGLSDQVQRLAQQAIRKRDWDEARMFLQIGMRWDTRLGEVDPTRLASLKKLEVTLERAEAVSQRVPASKKLPTSGLKSWRCENNEDAVTVCVKDWGSAWVQGATTLCKNAANVEACGKQVYCVATGAPCN